MPDWTSSQYTDVGLVRQVNEDALFALDQQQLWAVADGMGGHEAGDYASQYVVARLLQYERHRKLGVRMTRLHNALSECNQHLFEKATREHLGVIGCTFASLTIHHQQIVCSWSGDSRVYRLREGSLQQLTRDHNFRSLSEDRNILQYPDLPGGDNELLTAAIGGEEVLHLEHCIFELDRSDRFIICTDGLYKDIAGDELETHLNEPVSAEEIMTNLAELYKARGARDNVGVLYVYSQS